ncbi:MAG: hypothetical protein R6V21_11710, partial [Pelovirga sp.]
MDADTRNPDVGRVYRDYLTVEYIDLKQHEGWMHLLDFLEQDQDREIVVSLPAGIGQHLEKEADALSEALKDLGHQLVVYWPINRLKDSVVLLREFMKTPLMKQSFHTHVIMNGFFGEKEKFTRWLDSKTRSDFLMHEGAAESYLPELHHRVVDVVTGPFSQATDLKYSVKIELERWISLNYGLFFDQRRH